MAGLSGVGGGTENGSGVFFFFFGTHNLDSYSTDRDWKRFLVCSIFLSCLCWAPEAHGVWLGVSYFQKSFWTQKVMVIARYTFMDMLVGLGIYRMVTWGLRRLASGALLGIYMDDGDDLWIWNGSWHQDIEKPGRMNWKPIWLRKYNKPYLPRSRRFTHCCSLIAVPVYSIVHSEQDCRLSLRRGAPKRWPESIAFHTLDNGDLPCCHVQLHSVLQHRGTYQLQWRSHHNQTRYCFRYCFGFRGSFSVDGSGLRRLPASTAVSPVRLHLPLGGWWRGAWVRSMQAVSVRITPTSQVRGSICLLI
jgi:hypothetical protein